MAAIIRPGFLVTEQSMFSFSIIVPNTLEIPLVIKFLGFTLHPIKCITCLWVLLAVYLSVCLSVCHMATCSDLVAPQQVDLNHLIFTVPLLYHALPIFLLLASTSKL